ncbi:MAG: DUF1566 domain-containing protein [Leptospira sp.]|nr:DUF1566 domain-containing protein [Leptospira sp.]
MKPLSIFIFLFVLNCTLSLNNPCDLKSDEFNKFLFAKAILGDITSHCGLNFTGTVVPPSISSFSFVTTGSSASVSGTAQVSGVTPNDFRNPIVYSLSVANGNSKTYTVTVNPIMPVPDSGQVNCYDASALTTCGNGGFPGQDADYSNTPSMRSFVGPFTNTGFPSDFITRDSLTGLTVKTCTEGLSGATCATGGVTTMGWIAAGTACSGLNSGSGYAGKTNWRLPTVNELGNVVNYQNVAPTVDAAYFPATAQPTAYWAGLSYAINAANSWDLDYGLGTAANAAVGTANNVRCVAGDPEPSQNFSDKGDGTILDNNTSLVWQKCPVGLSGTSCATGGISTIDWATSLATCNSLTLAGKTWRLPNINELRSITDLTRTVAPVINVTAFPATGVGVYWASSTRLGTLTFAWVVNFSTGAVTTNSKAATSNVRCVSGP